ncbi:MAG: PVC-type heme-binding CxxCH protein [Pirellulales bacterium]
MIQVHSISQAEPLRSFAITILLMTNVTVAQTNFTPTVHHPNIASIKLFAENPEIVTPVGIAVSPDGRVFVQENHTHKRNSDYDGPKTDRILVFADTDGDGVSDKRSIFYQGHVFSTDLLFGPDGHLYVSTRWFVGRFQDAATKEIANGDPEKLVTCETDGDYPHNGVGGLAIDPTSPSWMAFGFGENLGADYTFVGSDGVKISGGGEGGSTYRCRTDGSNLERVSTGHWNAFGMTYDLEGNLFSTDNDPNSTPPNRLLHVVPGANFGYEYRYGRSGRHPLVGWYGENPGTLGMIGALGEAASGVTAYGSGHLLSASWTDNRIDIHPLKKQGASFVAGREQFLSGPDDFRPVHFSYTPDGKSLYFTDWVKLSYSVHGYGRIWRIDFKQPVPMAPLPRAPQSIMSADDAQIKLGDNDPYVRTEAMQVLVQHPEKLMGYDWKSDTNAVARAHYAVVRKRLDPTGHSNIIPSLLKDTNEDVRYVGIKWIADENLTQYKPLLEQQLNRSDISHRNLRSTVAALAKINGGLMGEFSPSGTMLALAEDTTKPVSLRTLALQGVKMNHAGFTVKKLANLAQSDETPIVREAIRALALHQDAKRSPLLSAIAADESFAPDLRADAIVGLAAFADENFDLLKKLTEDQSRIISDEAFRALVSTQLIMRKLPGKPPIDNIPAWEKFVDTAIGKADPAVGRRLFFHSRHGGCFKCHAMNGRGLEVGPDLTSIHKQSGINRAWLLEHIVNPNAEVAPYFRPQLIVTIDGKVYTGLILGIEGQVQAYIGMDGNIFFIDKNDVEERREVTTSIMPKGLLEPMTASEIRDLIAYLLNGGE